MTSSLLDQLTGEIRGIYQADPVNAAELVEERLSEELADHSQLQRDEILAALIDLFGHNIPPRSVSAELPAAGFNKLLTMLLGKEILKMELSSEEIIEQLAAALNTVFDSVNKLIGGINATLMGSTSGEETIRVVISASMDKEEGLKSLEKFLDQIGEFFAIALEAYKESARIKIGEILQELNPEEIARECDSSLKFGPLRKAHLYDCFQDKYQTLQNWQSSGLLLEAFLKEFEKNCQHLYLKRK